ncbi:MAG: amino acid adenylation domain-containing protein [Myxococcales bacterium]|nr:MAG: amino acid adenylation domain-containing protein [Myxococcales bacterium]
MSEETQAFVTLSTPTSCAAVPVSRALYPSELGVHQLFEAQASATPGATSVVMGGQSLTYQELNAKANALAGYLRTTGLREGECVAVYMDRSPSCLVALLAVLKAGATYVPIDLSLPEKRVAYILQDSDATRVLTDALGQSRIAELKESAPPALQVDKLLVELVGTENLDIPVDPQRAAYCIYTSGSTGAPKGVLVQHRAFMNYIWWAKKQYVTEDIKSFALYSSLAFDLTITSIFVPLVSGCVVHVYPETGDVHPLTEVIADNQVDLIKLTPAHLSLLVDADLSSSRLKTLILGGEDLKAAQAATVHGKLGGRAVIYNEYGPTETVVGCMIYRYDPQGDVEGSVPIGAGIDNVALYLLDAALKPVASGAVGEIYVGGDSVSLGYKGKPDLTNASFLKTPFALGKRLYATGDLARVNDQGKMVFLGRRDHQIKLRGYRIELGEIESALLAFPGIDACVVDSTKSATADAAAGLQHCVRCGLASNFPNTTYGEDGVCNHCAAFEKYQSVVSSYFGTMDDLRGIVEEMKRPRRPHYDCIVSLSGGKDSTYALCQMVELGARVFAFTLDNGYISDAAKRNIDLVVSSLGVDHRYVSTEHMNEIFVDSLKRHSNVCNGCFKAIYTFAINLAEELGVSHVVMGLSKGQLFETRLSALFRSSSFDNDSFEKSLVEARKIYHRIDDAVSRRLDMSCVQNDEVIEKTRFVDFFRYCHASREEMYAYIEKKVGWKRPGDTGRSTNCLLNDVGIYVHNKERGFHNYSLPYSWDVRMGHVSRQAALEELDDFNDINVVSTESVLAELGYALNQSIVGSAEAQLVAYYVSAQELPASDLRQFLSTSLPAYMVPKFFVQLDSIPLTPNGKVNRRSLPRPDYVQKASKSASARPATRLEEQLVELWKEVLRIDEVGIDDDFFELGGHSLPALMMLFKVDTQFNQAISIAEFSKVPTVSGLAALVGSAGAVAKS